MNTVKVRIAVGVDLMGNWCASGWSHKSRADRYDSDAMGIATENLDDGEARYWLTAELPLPASSEVEAKVEVAK